MTPMTHSSHTPLNYSTLSPHTLNPLSCHTGQPTDSPGSGLIKHPLSLEVEEQLSPIHIVQDKVELTAGLEGVVESH